MGPTSAKLENLPGIGPDWSGIDQIHQHGREIGEIRHEFNNFGQIRPGNAEFRPKLALFLPKLGRPKEAETK